MQLQSPGIANAQHCIFDCIVLAVSELIHIYLKPPIDFKMTVLSQEELKDLTHAVKDIQNIHKIHVVYVWDRFLMNASQ